MKKKIIIAVILSMLISGCGSENKNESENSDASQSSGIETTHQTENVTVETENTTGEEENTSDADNIGENAQVANNPLLDKIYGPDGEKVEKSLLSEIEVHEDNYFYAQADGIAYLAEPTGFCYNSVDTPEKMTGEDNESEKPELEYKRCKVGDTIMGLTIKEAVSNFRNDAVHYVDNGVEYTQEQLAEKGSFFSGCSVFFDGEVTMNGYLEIAKDDDYGIDEGDIHFVPSPDSEKLPVMFLSDFNVNNGLCGTYFTNYCGDFSWKSEYPTIILGNANTSAFDFSSVERGKYIKATVTVNNISISSDVGWLSTVRCDVVEAVF